MSKFYANPRFQASPAPDALPIPTKFMSRSLPKTDDPAFYHNLTSTPTSTHPTGDYSTSPIAANADYPKSQMSPPPSSQGTLLARLFQADQEQKSAKRKYDLRPHYDHNQTSPTRSQQHNHTSPQLHAVHSQPNLLSRQPQPSLPPPPDPISVAAKAKDRRQQSPVVDSKHIPPSVFVRQQNTPRKTTPQPENINPVPPPQQHLPTSRSNLEQELRKSLRLV